MHRIIDDNDDDDQCPSYRGNGRIPSLRLSVPGTVRVAGIAKEAVFVPVAGTAGARAPNSRSRLSKVISGRGQTDTDTQIHLSLIHISEPTRPY